MLTGSVVQFGKKYALSTLKIKHSYLICPFYVTKCLSFVFQDVPSVPWNSSGVCCVRSAVLSLLRPHGERPVQRHYWKERVQPFILVKFHRCSSTSVAAEGSLLVLNLVSVHCICYFPLSVSCRCLMRLVDDFLLITPDLHDAQTFLKYDAKFLWLFLWLFIWHQGSKPTFIWTDLRYLYECTFQISWLFLTCRKSIINQTQDEAVSLSWLSSNIVNGSHTIQDILQ